MHTRVLVIGQGLAGTALCLALEQADIDFVCADQGHRESASQVAAGLINPITGQRLVKSWGFEWLFPEAEKFYLQAELHLGVQIYFRKRIGRLFRSQAERELFERKFVGGELAPYAKSSSPVSLLGVRDATGAALFEPAAQIDIPALLKAARARWVMSGKLIESRFELPFADLSGPNVRWQDVSAEKLILCEGAAGLKNSPFLQSGLSCAKGEILTLRGPSLPFDTIINAGHWLLPTGPDSLRIGATYEPESEDLTLTQKGRTELEETARRVLAEPFCCTGQEAGIRAVTKDKLPIAGYMTNDSRIGVVNGLGSKGALYAPWLARLWSQHLGDDRGFSPEIDIRRFSV